MPHVLAVLARIAAGGGMVTAVLWAVAERRRSRRLRRSRQLPRSEYWGVYSDVLADLGGIDGESSGDISVERMPRR